MDVRPGYKQTEVGVIPEDWEVQSLEDIADPKRPICYGIVQVGPFTTNGIQVLAIKNLNTDYLTNIHRCSSTIELPYVRSRVNPGDVLISVKGTTGRVGIVPRHYEGNISRDIARFRLTDNDVPEFWFQMLQSETGQRKLDVATVGTTRMELSIGILKQVRMPRPPKKEQRAIATALSAVDALLGALDRLIAKKRDLKQAAMQQLLTGQTRLPGFHGAWESKRLDELGVWKGGMTPSMQNPSYWIGGNVPWISSGDVKSVLLTQTAFSVTRLAVKQGTTCLIPTNSIVLVMRSGILRKYLPVAMNVIPMAINQDIKALIPTAQCCPHFLLHALIGNGDQILARCLKAGTTVESIELRWLKAFTIQLPPKPEQTAVAEVLSDMDAELAALEQRRAKTQALKQGMMQELLTGRIRLVEG